MATKCVIFIPHSRPRPDRDRLARGSSQESRKPETRKQMHDRRDAEQSGPSKRKSPKELAREFQRDEVEPVTPAGSLNPMQMFHLRTIYPDSEP
jgi:hypothetical protein